MKVFESYKTFSEIASEFLIGKKISLKQRTYKGYISRLGVFERYIKNKGLSKQSLKNITNKQMSEFFNYLATNRNLDKPTCQKYYITLRSLYDFAYKIKEIKNYPFDLIVFPMKKKDMSPEIIPSKVLPILLNDIRENNKALYLACMMEYYCFIRPGVELRLLKIGDINLEEGYIHVSAENAKTGKPRDITMPVDLINICKEYNIDVEDKNKYVFGKKKLFSDKAIGINYFRYCFNKYRDKYNLSKMVKFYSFKHTGATTLANSKVVSIPELQKQLGHTRLTSTEHYVKKRLNAVNHNIRINFPNPLL